jgi:hypothetical protein
MWGGMKRTFMGRNAIEEANPLLAIPGDAENSPTVAI